MQHYPPAERQADQRRVLDSQVIQEREKIIGVGVGNGGIERPGGAEPTAVVAHHAKPGRQRLDLRIPHAQVQAEAVDEDDGRAVAGYLIGQAGARPGQRTGGPERRFV